MVIEFLLTCLVLFISSIFGTLVSGGAVFDSMFFISDLIPKEIHRLSLWCGEAFYTDSN